MAFARKGSWLFQKSSSLWPVLSTGSPETRSSIRSSSSALPGTYRYSDMVLVPIQEHALLMAVVWPLVITAVFLPLAVRRFQRLSR
jgi:hypothetical protein